jgi:8-oxo-dGTP pyrophosphatase MutT (NUDIX family)
MSYRAAILLFKNNQVALIERRRQGEHYYTFPGGHIEQGEAPEHAACREAEEELGLQVTIRRLVAVAEWQGLPQYYFLADSGAGIFGQGRGEEMLNPRPESGSYQAVWMEVTALLHEPVLPRPVVERVALWLKDGWPDEPQNLGKV